MAKFKISLINLNKLENGNTIYFKQPLSEFYGRTNKDNYGHYSSDVESSDKYEYCYTYNESFNESINSQKKLTFNMNRKITRSDRIEDNPFVYNIHIGTQLLFEDKHDRHHLFTVTNIKYDFKEFNLVYTYECQDSFTWQLSRQNSGYSIDNDVSSENFLGAKNVHDWARKICTDCNVIYVYKENRDLNDVKDFNITKIFSGSGTADSMLIALGELYGLQIQVYERYNETFNTITKEFKYIPLKSLKISGLKYSPYVDIQSFNLTHTGDSLSSVLNVKSHSVNDDLVSLIPSVPNFFRTWFQRNEWSKSTFTPGLFSSACNAESKYFYHENLEVLRTNNKQVRKKWAFNTNMVNKITLNQGEWGESGFSKYWGVESGTKTIIEKPFKIGDNSYQKMEATIETEIIEVGGQAILGDITFTNIKVTLLNGEKISIGPNDDGSIINQSYQGNITISEYSYSPFLDYYYTGLDELPEVYGMLVDNKLEIPLGEFAKNEVYSYVRFSSHGNISRLQYITTDNQRVIVYNTSFDWKLKSSTLNLVFNPGDETPVNEPCQWSVLIDVDNVFHIEELEVFLDFYRIPSKEDIEFAEIADKCPWLENKLFNFNYFINHNIINLKQYKELMSLIQNDLRKANAKLLLYSQLYYQELKNKTEKISKLESNIDTLGAIFNASFIQPINENKPFESSAFVTAYSALFNKGNEEMSSGKVTLLDYNKTLTKYLNSYITAEQTFLKNIQLFKNYFYAKTNRDNLYRTVITITNDEDSDERVCFSTPYEYTKITNAIHYMDHNLLPTVNLYQKQGENYCAIAKDDIVSIKSLTDESLYYRPPTGYFPASGLINKDVKYYEEHIRLKDTTDASEIVDAFKDMALPFSVKINNREGWEVYKVNYIGDKSISLRPIQHCICDVKDPGGELKIEAVFLQDNGTSISRIWENNETKWEYFYEEIGLYEMKCNYFYRLKKSNTCSNEWYRRVECALRPVSKIFENIDTGCPVESFFPVFKNNFRSLKNHEDENPGFDSLYAENFPLTTLYYKNTTDGTYKEVGFINAENAQTFYRRISVNNWWKNANDCMRWVGPFRGICLIATAVYKYGGTSWGTEGWTYQDVYGNKIKSPFNSSWTHNKSEVYVTAQAAKNEDDWIKTNDKDKKAESIIHTLFSLRESSSQGNYYYRPYYLRALLPNDILFEGDEYLMLVKTPEYNQINTSGWNAWYEVAYEWEDAATIKPPKQGTRLDAIIWYPLVGSMVGDVLNTGVSWHENQTRNTISNLLGINKDTIQLDDDDRTKTKVQFYRVERYDEQKLKDYYEAADVHELAISNWYNEEEEEKHTPINWQNQSDLTTGFFVLRENEQYTKVTNLNGELKEDVFYYKLINNEYIQKHTLKQLLSQNNIYIKNADYKEHFSFSETDEIELPVKIYQKQEDGVYAFDRVESRTFKVNADFTWEEANNITNLDNGTFWSKFINRTDQPILMQEAMLIEANLSDYWLKAYYASRNCKYFIPQFWQPSVNGQSNNFSNEIMTRVNYSSNDGDWAMRLLSKYIPIVSSVSNQPTLTMTITENPDALYDNENYYSSTTASALYPKHKWLKDIMDYLNLGVDVTATILDYNATYYTHESGGQTWLDVLKQYSNNTLLSYTYFGGWYDMAINALKNYQDCSITQYEDALLEHNAVWTKIYKTYPNLIYEKSFEYQNALTSKQLFDAADFAFRQYTDVERQYNIQTIDLAQLKGYEGQELRIGDAIELDANEFYDAYDDIKTSLLQYLYISDISYKPRSDAEIQLTVNNIKYSDKVISELVKLIR